MINDLNIANRSESLASLPIRPMSAKIFRPRCASAKRQLPLSSTVNSNSNFNINLKLSSNLSNLSHIANARKVNHIIEKEKLHEQVMQYKIITYQLQRELNSLKTDLKDKVSQIAIKDKEITTMLQKIESPEDLEKETESEGSNANLLSKIRRECRKIELELDEESNMAEVLKKNKKITKTNEYVIELQIINKQIDQIRMMLDNSLNNRDSQIKEIFEYEKYEQTLSNQCLIIESLQASLNYEIQRERELRLEMDLLQKKIKEDNETIDKITKDNAKMMQTNNIIQQEKKKAMKDPRSRLIINDSATLYEKRINDLESQAFQYKQEANKSDKAVNELQMVKNSYLKAKGMQQQMNDFNSSTNANVNTNTNANTNANSNIIYGQNNKQIEASKIKSQEIESEVLRLREILKNSKAKEEEFANIIYEYEEKIKSYSSEYNSQQNIISIGINKDNPFYTEDPNNDPIQTQRFTNAQYTQFIFVLFKNFESKGITQEIANEKILEKLIPNSEDQQQHHDSIKDLMEIFASRTIQLLQCKHEPDRLRLEILFGALCYNCNSDFNSVFVNFLSLFDYITFYTKENEDKMKRNIKKKYSSLFNRLKLKVRELDIKGDYISLIQLKKVIDDNITGIKDKYFAFLLYLMKKFDDENASLFDLKLRILFQLDTESDLAIGNKNDNSNNLKKNDNDNNKLVIEDNMSRSRSENQQNDNDKELNESVQEITSEEYEKLIYDSLKKIKEYLMQSTSSLREYLKDCIITIDEPSTCQVVIIESLNDQLRKKNIILSDLQLSCLCAKYCINDKLKALSIVQLENDLKAFALIQS